MPDPCVTVPQPDVQITKVEPPRAHVHRPAFARWHMRLKQEKQKSNPPPAHSSEWELPDLDVDVKTEETVVKGKNGCSFR